MEDTPIQEKKRKLTKKQRGFVRDYAMTENATRAVLKNYEIGRVHGTKNPIHVATVIGHENLSKPYILEAVKAEQESLKQALIDAGGTPQKIAETIVGLLDEEDANAKDKGITQSLKIYRVEEVAPPPQNVQVNIFNNPRMKEAMDEFEKKAMEQLGYDYEVLE